ncbi:MAG: LysR substrate-binding domain-containing protein [Endozoicomonas sp.]
MKYIDVSRVDLNLLTAFETLYQERSVSAAARRMYLGQPAMSHALARLRKLFDDNLLERHGQQMQPTRRAEELYPVVHAVLDEIREKILEQTAFDPAAMETTVRIGLNDYSELVFARPLFDKLTAEAPGIRASFITVNRANAFNLLKAGKLDIALGHWPDAPEDISTEDLYTEQHVCLFDNQVLQCELPLSLEDYVATPHALSTPEGVLTGKVDELLADLGRKRNVVLGCSRFVSLLDLLKGKRLLSVVPEILSRLDRSDHPLTSCKPPLPVPDFDISLAWRRSDGHHPLLRWLKTMVSDVVTTERQKIYFG